MVHFNGFNKFNAKGIFSPFVWDFTSEKFFREKKNNFAFQSVFWPPTHWKYSYRKRVLFQIQCN